MSITLTGANQQTEWFDLNPCAVPVTFILSGDFQDAVGVQYSNNTAVNKGTDWIAGTATYATKTGPLMFPERIARFVRFFSGNAWTGGKTCVPSFGLGENSSGQTFQIGVQGN